MIPVLLKALLIGHLSNWICLSPATTPHRRIWEFRSMFVPTLTNVTGCRYHFDNSGHTTVDGFGPFGSPR